MRGAYGLGQYNASAFTFGGVQADGSGQTICIVDAYDYPTALNDVNAFSNNFNLPTFNTSGGPTFTKYGVTEGFGTGYGLTTTLPGVDPSSPSSSGGDWETEESLDIEWAHVMAPRANIILVEGSDSNLGLYYGDYYGAAVTGVVAVSNSWSGDEFNGENGDDFVFTTPSGHIGGGGLSGGVSFVFAAGDGGAYERGGTAVSPQYPSDSPNVVSVGGTSLTPGPSNTYGSESAWGHNTSSGTLGGGGGGISAYETQPSYQSGVVSAFSTTKRTYPDIALEADPGTYSNLIGVPIYDSYDFGTATPWINGDEGGTSLACPMMAGLLAVANQGRNSIGIGSLDGYSQTLPDLYTMSSLNYHDITTGNNGYAAGNNYDLASGIGSPIADPFIINLSGALNNVVGTSGVDTIRLVRSSNNLLVYRNNTSVTYYNVPYSTLPAVTVNGLTGSDNFFVDFSGGTPVPAAGLTVTGTSLTDALTVTGTTGNDVISIGTNTITLGSSTFTYASISSVTINGDSGSDSLTQTAQPGFGTTLVFNGATSGGPSSTDSLNISSGTYTFAAPASGAGINALPLASLSINAGASVTVQTAANHSDRWYLLLGTLNIGGLLNAWTGKLDLGGNDMVIHGGSLPTVFNQVAVADRTGQWNGFGIGSAKASADTTHRTAIGMLLNSAGIFNASKQFDLYTPATTDLLIKYTYYGDTNLDGKTDASDYSVLDSSYLSDKSFPASNPVTGWSNGDFNYDSKINGSDYTLIDNTFNTQGATLAAQIAAPALKSRSVIAPPSPANLTPAATSLFSDVDIADQKHRVAVEAGLVSQ